MKDKFYLGIDVGNAFTKSQNTTCYSGYDGPSTIASLMAKHSLFLDGKYYFPSTCEFLPYMRDKTLDERALVLTLISAATEMIFQFAKKENGDKEAIQHRISEVKHISLGVGLPIADYKKQNVEQLKNYYMKHMGEGINFVYDDYDFSFVLDNCEVYPQGYSATLLKDNTVKEYGGTYYVVDIGGFTVDVAHFDQGQIAKDGFSLNEGIIVLYDKIIQDVDRQFDRTLTYNLIKAIIDGRKTVLEQEVIDYVYAATREHANMIVKTLRQKRVALDSNPCLFVGGGSALLKKYICENPGIDKNKVQFIVDSTANAKGYAKLIRMQRS